MQNKYTSAIIFEDDIVIKTKSFNSKINNFIQAIPDTYDIGWLEGVALNSNLVRKYHQNKAEPFYRKQDSHWMSMYSYVLSYKGAEKLIKTELYSKPIDVFLAGIAADIEPSWLRNLNISTHLDGYVNPIHILTPFGDTKSTIFGVENN